MFLWILAVCVMGVVALVSYYQGALRAAFSLIGLLVGALLALPMAGIMKFVLPALGLRHPVLVAFLALVVMYVLILIAFKVAAFAVNRKLETYYKYKASDTHRGLWDRMNHRVGICVGLVNGAIYVFLIGVVFYTAGYFTMQMATSDKDKWILRVTNALAQDLQSTQFDKALAPFLPQREFYYDAVDVLSYIFHTPLLQSRLSSYPPFLKLAEEPRFENVAKDTKFQQLWLQQPSLSEFIQNANINPLVKDASLFTNVVSLLDGDLQDFKTYLETGQSAKYGDERILGPWEFSVKASYSLARRNKPSMPIAEKRWLQAFLQTGWSGAIFTAYIDQTASLKRPAGKGKTQDMKGKWKRVYGSKYNLSVKDGGTSLDFEAVVQGRRLTLSQEKLSLVFEK
jgi:hypothetical protein